MALHNAGLPVGSSIPPSLKLIHSRVYAQGITLGALVAMAAILLEK